MAENWKCPRCKAFNPSRRQVCWQCKYARSSSTPLIARIRNSIRRVPRWGLLASAILFSGILGLLVFAIFVWGRQIAEKQSASGAITVLGGGTVELAGDTRVDVPPDALASAAEIRISIPTQLEKEIIPPKNIAFLIREINAGGVALKHPIRLTFSYAGLQLQDSLSPDAVFIARWDGKDWQYLGGDIDASHKTVTIETDHLSRFGVFALPSLNSLFSNLKSLLPTCESSGMTFDLELTQLATAIRESNPEEISLPNASVHLKENHFNFSAEPGGYIVGDRTWFEQESEWLPEGKRYLLLDAILAHELSHLVRGTTDVEITSLILQEASKKFSTKDFLDEMGTYLYALALAAGRGDCEAARAHRTTFIAFLNTLIFRSPSIKEICIQQQQRELTADEDGVRWAGRYSGEMNAVGLVFLHWHQRKPDSGDNSCLHPSGLVRAQQIRDLFDLGPIGGVVGTVLAPDQKPLSDVSITIEEQITERTDENGQFLITGLSAGPHTVTFSRSGFQSLTRSVEVPSQGLTELSGLQLSAVTPLDRKDRASVLQSIQDALQKNDITIFEQLMSDEWQGYFNYIEGGLLVTKQEFLSDLEARLPSNPSCDGYAVDSSTGGMQIWTSGWTPAWEMNSYCYVDCWELDPPWTSNVAAFFLGETAEGWSISGIWLNDLSSWQMWGDIQLVNCDGSAPAQDEPGLGSIDRTDVNALVQRVNYGLEQRDIGVFEDLAADQAYYHTGGFSNFALSTEGWYSKADFIMNLFDSSEVVKCAGYSYSLREDSPDVYREPKYQKSPVTYLTIYMDNLRYMVFTNGLSPGDELYITEYGWYHPDTVSAGYGPPADMIPCP